MSNSRAARWIVGLWTSIGVMSWPLVVFADDCSSEFDCQQTPGYNTTTTIVGTAIAVSVAAVSIFVSTPTAPGASAGGAIGAGDGGGGTDPDDESGAATGPANKTLEGDEALGWMQRRGMIKPVTNPDGSVSWHPTSRYFPDDHPDMPGIVWSPGADGSIDNPVILVKPEPEAQPDVATEPAIAPPSEDTAPPDEVQPSEDTTSHDAPYDHDWPSRDRSLDDAPPPTPTPDAREQWRDSLENQIDVEKQQFKATKRERAALVRLWKKNMLKMFMKLSLEAQKRITMNPTEALKQLSEDVTPESMHIMDKLFEKHDTSQDANTVISMKKKIDQMQGELGEHRDNVRHLQKEIRKFDNPGKGK